MAAGMSELIYQRLVEADPKRLGEYQKRILEYAKQATVIKVDNVARYFFEVSPQHEWDLQTDFPNLAPPFEVIWMEYKAPIQMNVNGLIQSIPHEVRTGNIGALLVSEKVPDEVKETTRTNAFWKMSIIQFSELPALRRGITLSPFINFLGITYEGQLAYLEDKPFHMVGFDKTRIAEFEKMGITPDHAQRSLTAVYPMLLGLSFLHCKNVDLTQSGTVKRQRKKRQEGEPKVKIYTLQIEPIRKILEDAGSKKTGIKQALHICRGHFKDFSKGKGLFGKYQGMYWWEAQVRGNAALGFIAKDYQIDSGQPANLPTAQDFADGLARGFEKSLKEQD
jgi:hypothetical protein